MGIFVELDITHKSIALILFTNYLILHTSFLTWYYSQDLQHRHLNHIRIFVGLDITHKSIVLIVLTRLENDFWCFNLNTPSQRGRHYLPYQEFPAILILSRKCQNFVTDIGLSQICNLLISSYVLEFILHDHNFNEVKLHLNVFHHNTHIGFSRNLDY